MAKHKKGAGPKNSREQKHTHGHEHGHEHAHDHEHEHDHGPQDVATRSHTHFVTEHHHTQGHPDDCGCEVCNPHIEYCDVCGESLAKCTCVMPDEKMEKRVYILEGLDCANCAAKVEAKIRQMPEVEYASVAYATKQLRVSAQDHTGLMEKMQAAIDAIEDGITLVPRNRKSVATVSKTKVYVLEGLDCPNCAAKIERKIKTMDGVDDVSITYANKQMRLSAGRPDVLIPAIQSAIDAMEDGITVIPKEEIKKEAKKEEKSTAIPERYKPLVTIGIGAVLFLIGFSMIHIGGLEESDLRLLPLFVVSYLILGGKVLMTAARNIRKGQVFDENLLMCIATLGAFAIREFPEAVGVMLFYRIGEYFEDRATEQSRSQIMDAVDLRPEVVNLLVGDEVRVMDAEEAVVGDILLVRPGDRVPLDGVVIEGETRLDTSAITGEPVPVRAGVGDGINDAPVLAGADVGAAMGSGADAAIEAADVVFMTSEMDAIPQAIDIARVTARISWQNVYFALGVKVIVMVAGLSGYANMWVAVFADTGVSVLCLLNSIRILYRK